MARIVNATPSTLVSTIERQCSGDSSRNPRLAPKPALANTASIRPKASSAACASAWTSSHSATSQRTAIAASAPPSSSLSASSRSSRRAPRASR